MAAERGRKTKPKLKLGICGEHGGDPASIAFCQAGGAGLRLVQPVPRAGGAAGGGAGGAGGGGRPDGVGSLSQRSGDMLSISRIAGTGSMTHITVGRWGKNLAVRFPGDIARAAGLIEGERVEIETRGGEIVLRRVVPHLYPRRAVPWPQPGGVAGGLCGRLRLADRTLAVSASRNDGAGLHSQCRRSDLDRLRSDTGPGAGGRRPALVVSPAAFTENTGFAIVCPITSRVRPFPTSVVLPAGLPVAGEI